MDTRYCESLFRPQRLRTHEVRIGDVPLGGTNPIRVQSMTTTDTMDTAATVAQTLRMVESGSEYVRITAPSLKEARNLAEIKKQLRAAGCTVPLVADIHFTPKAAEEAARIVEKVRVNPGNYADKKKFETLDYTDSAYEAELERIHDRFAPLVKICKEHGTAMRIGANHGSLSDRIMSRYGDTPLGMVESALEFLRICEMYSYDQVVISMKASNPLVMVQAYRLLVNKMMENGIVYPLHLGVTEAGEGEDGRVKSAQGIGALLMDGIGDTVRVSLTEEPEYESPVAKFLIEMFQAPTYAPEGLDTGHPDMQMGDPFHFQRRETSARGPVGGGQVPVVVAGMGPNPSRGALAQAGYRYAADRDKYDFNEMAADFAFVGDQLPPFDMPGSLNRILDHKLWGSLRADERNFPLFRNVSEFKQAPNRHPALNFVCVDRTQWEEGLLAGIDGNDHAAIVLEGDPADAGHFWRIAAAEIRSRRLDAPILLKVDAPGQFNFYEDSNIPDPYKLSAAAKKQLWLAAMSGAALIDGWVDGLWFGGFDEHAVRTAFGALQAGRLRITKTEYISCPSCGRTLFDLQETTARIRSRTEHLKGVKIGIMGCIVNGPGEMADADYGYVGVGPDKIALYRGKEVVERALRTAEAVEKLIQLIREDGNWIEASDTPNNQG